MTESETVRKIIGEMMEKAKDIHASPETINNANLSLIAIELAEIVDALKDARGREDES